MLSESEQTPKSQSKNGNGNIYLKESSLSANFLQKIKMAILNQNFELVSDDELFIQPFKSS